MFTYAGKFRASGAHNEMPADDLETAKLHIEEIACLALLEIVGPIVMERVELEPAESAATDREYTLEIVLHSPDHSTRLRREMLATVRRQIDGTLRPLLTELFGRVRVVRTTLTYADRDGEWGEVGTGCMPEEVYTSAGSDE